MEQVGDLRVQDVMKRDVARLDAGASVAEALELFEELHIGGAPVVDSVGDVVGVLSASDLVQRATARNEDERAGAGGRNGGGFAWATEEEDEEVVLDTEGPRIPGTETVADWMTREVVSIASDATLRQAAETMTRHSVHRVLVLRGKKLEGIVTSTDIVRAVAEHGGAKGVVRPAARSQAAKGEAHKRAAPASPAAKKSVRKPATRR